MFSLIITIVAIALVAALALATIYYGGTAFNKGATAADAARAISQGQQIQGAMDLFRADFTRWPTKEEMLGANEKGFVYLRSWPDSKATAASLGAGQEHGGVVQSAIAQALPASAPAANLPNTWRVPTNPVQPTAVLADSVTEKVCAQINLMTRGDNGIANKVSTAYATQCFSPGNSRFVVVVTKAGYAELLTGLNDGGGSPPVVTTDPLNIADPGDPSWVRPPDAKVSPDGTGSSPQWGVGTDSSAPAAAVLSSGSEWSVVLPPLKGFAYVRVTNYSTAAAIISYPADDTFSSMGDLGVKQLAQLVSPGFFPQLNSLLPAPLPAPTIAFCQEGQSLAHGQSCVALIAALQPPCAGFPAVTLSPGLALRVNNCAAAVASIAVDRAEIEIPRHSYSEPDFIRQARFSVANTGGVPVTIAAVLGGPEYVVGGGCTQGPVLAPGESCNVTAELAQGLGNGTYIASISVMTTEGLEASSRVTATLENATPGALDPTDTVVDFGTITAPSSTRTQTVSLTNTGGSPVSIQGLRPGVADGTKFTAEGDCLTGGLIPAGVSCNFTLVFNPSQAGLRVGPLDGAVVLDTSSGPVSVRVLAQLAPGVEGDAWCGSLSGACDGDSTPAQIEVSPSSLNLYYQRVSGSDSRKATATLTLTNSGSGQMFVDRLLFAPDADPSNQQVLLQGFNTGYLSIAQDAANCLTLGVPANSSCTIEIQANSLQAIGPLTGRLEVRSSAGVALVDTRIEVRGAPQAQQSTGGGDFGPLVKTHAGAVYVGAYKNAAFEFTGDRADEPLIEALTMAASVTTTSGTVAIPETALTWGAYPFGLDGGLQLTGHPSCVVGAKLSTCTFGLAAQSVQSGSYQVDVTIRTSLGTMTRTFTLTMPTYENKLVASLNGTAIAALSSFEFSISLAQLAPGQTTVSGTVYLDVWSDGDDSITLTGDGGGEAAVSRLSRTDGAYSAPLVSDPCVLAPARASSCYLKVELPETPVLAAGSAATTQAIVTTDKGTRVIQMVRRFVP